MNSWPGLISEGPPDPLAGFYDRPILSGASATGGYLGRVVIELWEGEGLAGGDSSGLAYSIGNGIVDEKTLIQKVAIGLPGYLDERRSILRRVPKLLASVFGVPMISGAGPTSSYVGRAILEMWEEEAVDDSFRLECAVDAPAVDDRTFLERIAAALPVRLRQDPW